MARFDDTPPIDPVPRPMPEMPEQANLPEALEGLPTIPVIDMPEDFPEDMPDEVSDQMPWA